MGNKKVVNGRPGVMPFSFDEVLDAIRPVVEDGPEGFTSYELAKYQGISINAAQVRIRESILSGKLKFNGRRRGISVDGRPCVSPVYTVV